MFSKQLYIPFNTSVTIQTICFIFKFDMYKMQHIYINIFYSKIFIYKIDNAKIFIIYNTIFQVSKLIKSRWFLNTSRT